ncbi:twin-arginine translocation signal domain-containing protein [Streptomyces sp. NPDC096040]
MPESISRRAVLAGMAAMTVAASVGSQMLPL